jgi:hypothetical protein
MTPAVERSGAIWWQSTRPLNVHILNTLRERNSKSAHHDVTWFSCNTRNEAEVLKNLGKKKSVAYQANSEQKDEGEFFKLNTETS